MAEHKQWASPVSMRVWPPRETLLYTSSHELHSELYLMIGGKSIHATWIWSSTDTPLLMPKRLRPPSPATRVHSPTVSMPDPASMPSCPHLNYLAEVAKNRSLSRVFPGNRLPRTRVLGAAHVDHSTSLIPLLETTSLHSSPTLGISNTCGISRTHSA